MSSSLPPFAAELMERGTAAVTFLINTDGFSLIIRVDTYPGQTPLPLSAALQRWFAFRPVKQTGKFSCTSEHSVERCLRGNKGIGSRCPQGSSWLVSLVASVHVWGANVRTRPQKHAPSLNGRFRLHFCTLVGGDVASSIVYTVIGLYTNLTVQTYVISIPPLQFLRPSPKPLSCSECYIFISRFLLVRISLTQTVVTHFINPISLKKSEILERNFTYKF